jgi:hypothetical protein
MKKYVKGLLLLSLAVQLMDEIGVSNKNDSY